MPFLRVLIFRFIHLHYNIFKKELQIRAAVVAQSHLSLLHHCVSGSSDGMLSYFLMIDIKSNAPAKCQPIFLNDNTRRTDILIIGYCSNKYISKVLPYFFKQSVFLEKVVLSYIWGLDNYVSPTDVIFEWVNHQCCIMGCL